MTKQQEEMNKRFDERFMHSDTCDRQRFEDFEKEPFADCYCQLKEIKSFLQSEIDLAVAEERKQIVEILSQQKAKLDNCNNVDGRCQDECFKKKHRAEDWNEVIRRILSLIKDK